MARDDFRKVLTHVTGICVSRCHVRMTSSSDVKSIEMGAKWLQEVLKRITNEMDQALDRSSPRGGQVLTKGQALEETRAPHSMCRKLLPPLALLWVTVEETGKRLNSLSFIISMSISFNLP